MTIKSVGSASRDYSTVALALAACPADLVAANDSWQLELYNDSEFIVTTETAIAGITTDATRNIRIRCATGQSHKSAAGVALRYNQSNGVAIRTTTAGLKMFVLSVPFTTINGLQIKSDVNSNYMNQCLWLEDAASDCRIDQCIFEGQSGLGYFVGAVRIGGGANNIFVNNLVVALNQFGSGLLVWNCPASTVIANNTVVKVTGGLDSGGAGIIRVYSDAAIVANAIFGFTSVGATVGAGSNAASGYNATDAASVYGSNSLTGLVFADQFIDVNLDFRLKAGSNLEAAAIQFSQTADFDIRAQARDVSTPDIGAWEYQPPNVLVGSISLTITPTAVARAVGRLTGTVPITITPVAILRNTDTTTPAPLVWFDPDMQAARLFDEEFVLEGWLDREWPSSLSGAIYGAIALTLTPAALARAIGRLTGSSALTLTPAALARATGTILGTSPLAFSIAGVLRGVGRITGTIPLTLTPAALLIAIGRMTGSSPLVFSASAFVSYIAPISGSTSITLTPIATARGIGRVQGTATLLITPTATARASASLSGTCALVISPEGVLTYIADNALIGSSHLVFTGSGSLKALASIAGAASITVTPSGLLRAIGRVVGTVPITLQLTGNLKALANLLGTVPLTFTPAADLNALGRLTGTVPIALTPAADLNAIARLLGTSTLALALAGTLRATARLSGTSTISITPAGVLRGIGSVAGALTLTLTPSATGQTNVSASGVIALSISPSGTVRALARVQGSVPLQLTPAGTLTGIGRATGVSSLTLSASGALTGIGTLQGLAAIVISLIAILRDSNASSVPNSIQTLLALLANTEQLLTFALQNSVQTIAVPDADTNSAQLFTIPSGDLNSSQTLSEHTP